MHFLNATFAVSARGEPRLTGNDAHVVDLAWVPPAELPARLIVAVVREPLLATLRGESRRYFAFADAGITIEFADRPERREAPTSVRASISKTRMSTGRPRTIAPLRWRRASPKPRPSSKRRDGTLAGTQHASICSSSVRSNAASTTAVLASRA